MGDVINTPLQENEHVKELLAIMEQNRVNTDDLRGLLGYVGAMERQLDTAVGELQAMRQELNNMREEQNHPVRTALQNTIRTLEKGINEARERLDAIKESIVEGCKNAVSAFREKGISALHNVMDFFKVKDTLLDVRKGMDAAVKSAEKSIAKIEAVSAEYHEIGKHVKNIARAFTGKEAVQDAKPVGKLARATQAPHRFRKAVVSRTAKGVDAAIGKLEKMEQPVIEKKPSVLENLQAMKEQVAQAKRDAPAADKPLKRNEASL